MIFGIRYIASESKMPLSESYEKIYSNEEVTLYKNPYALSLAYVVSGDINKVSFDKETAQKEGKTYISSDTPFERLNNLLTAMVGERITIYEPLAHSISKENSRESASRTKFSPVDDSVDSFVSFTAIGNSKNKEVYAYFPTLYYTDAAMYINGVEMGRYFNNASVGYIYVGSYSNVSDATVKFKINAEGIYLDRNVKYFYTLNEAELRRVYDILSCAQYEIEICEEDHFVGNITVENRNSVILTTIPYDKGWQITANGERIDAYMTLDALLAFNLNAGEYTLEMRYMPIQYIYGFLISLVGILALSLVVISDYKNNKRNRKEKLCLTI